MRPSLETAVHWFDGAGWVLVAALVVGAICTITIVFMGIVKEGYWDESRESARLQIAALEAETAIAKADVEKAHVAIANANKEIALARERTAELAKDAADARERTAEVMKASAWRHFTQRQKDILIEALAQNSGKYLLAWVANDPESFSLALTFANLLHEKIPGKWDMNNPAKVFPTTLVWGIFIPDAPGAAPTVELLRDAFRKAGITFTTEALPEESMAFGVGGKGDPDRAIVLFGSRPPSFEQPLK